MPERPRAVILDLDAAVIDSAGAWRYALEEAVMMVTGERRDTEPLVEEYRSRPWAHVVPILVDGPDEQRRCVDLCEQFYRRSALKRLLVFDGIGMALDQLRGESVEMGGVTREPHGHAMRQIESTGIDRFLAVLSPTNEGDWDPRQRFEECVWYLEAEPDAAVYVSPFEEDLERVRPTGASTLHAGWVTGESQWQSIPHPKLLLEAARLLVSADAGNRSLRGVERRDEDAAIPRCRGQE